jgi:hypothetical protein
MSERHTAHDGGQRKAESGTTDAENDRGEHFNLTPEEERRGTPLQQEIAGEEPEIAGDQDEPVPNGPAPDEPDRHDPAQPSPDPNRPDPMRPYPEPGEPDPARPYPKPGDPRPTRPTPDPNLPDPMRPYPEPGDPDPTRPLPGGPVPPRR